MKVNKFHTTLEEHLIQNARAEVFRTASNQFGSLYVSTTTIRGAHWNVLHNIRNNIHDTQLQFQLRTHEISTT